MASSTPVSRSDHKVLCALDGDLPRSQRDIARSAGLSLGSTNAAIRRLLATGHLRVDEVNGRKNRYLLTERGTDEKRQNTLYAVARAVHEFALIKKTVQDEVLRACAGGVQLFCIVGDGDLADLAETALRDLRLPNLQYARARTGEDVPRGTQAVLLTDARTDTRSTGGVVLELPALFETAMLR